LESTGQLDHTLIMVVSDNGASAEGGPHGSINENLFVNKVPDDLKTNLKYLDKLGGVETYNHYAWGWTWAGKPVCTRHRPGAHGSRCCRTRSPHGDQGRGPKPDRGGQLQTHL
jgi:arylsulfatase A-like enzyme